MSRGRSSTALVPIATFVAGRGSSPTADSGAGNGNRGKSSGRFGVAMSVHSHTVDQAAATGAPTGRRPPVQPVILPPNGVAPMTKPRHPAAGLLWTDRVLTKGQVHDALSRHAQKGS